MENEKLLITQTFCLRTSWQQPIRRVQSGTFWLNVIITQKKYYLKMKDFLLFTQSFHKTFLSGVVKNRKCLAKHMVKLVLARCRIFCLIFNNLCDIKDFFFLKGKQIRFQDQTAILCSFLLLHIGSKRCIRSDRLVRHFTIEQNSLDRCKINTFAGNNKHICRLSYTARFVSDRPENNTSKGEKIGFQYFLPFPKMISNS